MLPARLNPNYGKGQATAEMLDAETLSERLQAVFADPNYNPPTLPQASMRVATMTRGEVSFRDVEAVLETDPVLTGQVLKVASSPVYSNGRPITSLSQALSRLGLATVRDLVMQVALSSRVFRCKSYQKVLDSLVRHSTAVAHATRRICRQSSLDAEYSFLCGLLHDVGIAGAFIALADGSKNPPDVLEAWSAVHEVHAEASKVMATHWGMSPDLQPVLEYHHTVEMGGYPHPMAAAVRLAGFIVDGLGYELSVQSDDMFLPKLQLPQYAAHRCIEALNLSERQVEQVREGLEKELPELCA